MSVDYTTYVGPFVRVTYHMISVDVPRGTTCPVTDCPNYGEPLRDDPKFCPECGTATARRVTVSELPSFSHWDVFRDAGLGEDPMSEYHSDGDDRGSPPEYWFVPNGGTVDGLGRDCAIRHRQGTGIHLATPDWRADVESEKAWLAREFAAEVAALRAVADAVTVEWGVITHAS